MSGWKQIDSESVPGGKGIRITFKNGSVEEFLNFGKVKYVAQIYNSEWANDEAENNCQVGYYNDLGKWVLQANFPNGSYQYVRVISK
jgi:hypothetical protein